MRLVTPSIISEFIRCLWLTVISRIYHFSTISPENVASAAENKILRDLIRAQVLERIN